MQTTATVHVHVIHSLWDNQLSQNSAYSSVIKFVKNCFGKTHCQKLVVESHCKRLAIGRQEMEKFLTPVISFRVLNTLYNIKLVYTSDLSVIFHCVSHQHKTLITSQIVTSIATRASASFTNRPSCLTMRLKLMNGHVHKLVGKGRVADHYNLF